MAYHHIQRKISTRELRAGEPVSDVTISKELGISRTPAREAIRQLVSEGLLESVPGRGVVVITLDRDDIRELFEMREALEGLAARTVAARSPSAGEIRDLRSIASALTALIKELAASRKPVLDEKQMERFEVADLAFHTYIMKLAGNQRSLKTLAGIRLLIRIFAARRGGHNIAKLKQINRDHLDLISALQAADPQAAADCVHRHILEEPEEPAERVRPTGTRSRGATGRRILHGPDPRGTDLDAPSSAPHVIQKTGRIPAHLLRIPEPRVHHVRVNRKNRNSRLFQSDLHETRSSRRGTRPERRQNERGIDPVTCEPAPQSIHWPTEDCATVRSC